MPVSRRDPPFSYDSQRVPPKRNAKGRLWIGIFIAVLAGVGGLGAYLYFYQRDVLAPYLRDTPLQSSPAVTTLYKWQDASGGWQVSDKPPPQGTPYKELKLRSDVNIVPALETPQSKK